MPTVQKFDLYDLKTSGCSCFLSCTPSLSSAGLKIEELYEAYCRQRRLRDGAEKMVKAYTASSSSKEARESLSEANKSYKEYTEVRGGDPDHHHHHHHQHYVCEDL